MIEDQRTVRLPGSLAPGQYSLIVGVYDPNTGARLNTSDGKAALTLVTVDVRSSTPMPNSTPTPTSAAFPTDIYPPPVAVAPGIIISPMGTGCPNPDGLEKADQLPRTAVNEVFRSLASGDVDTMRRVTDPAYWPFLRDMGIGTPRPFSEDALSDAQPASESPCAGLIGNACRSKTLELSWWVKSCPGPCTDPDVARSASLMGNFYLIQRRGHWLAWAAE